MSNTKYDQPLVSIDVVPIRFDRDLQTLRVALGERVNEPFKGQLALPGVLLVKESVEDAAYRALEEKVGYKREDVLALLHIGVFDAAMRDPRGPTLSIGYAAIIKDEPVQTDLTQVSFERVWRVVDNRLDALGVANVPLPFDHDTIIAAAVEELGVRLWTDQDITRALLGAQFSTRGAAALTERLRGVGSVDKTNFNRTLKSQPYLLSTGKIAEGVGRSSSLWQFRDSPVEGFVSLAEYARECDILTSEALRRWQKGKIADAQVDEQGSLRIPQTTAEQHARQGHAD